MVLKKSSNNVWVKKSSDLVKTNKAIDENSSYMQEIIAEDIQKFGIIPELIGRLPVFAALEQLTVDDLVRILKEPRNALVKQYQTLLSYDDVELEFDDEALQEIANKAIERKTGARGLRSIIEETMLDVMFEVPSQENVKIGPHHKRSCRWNG